jgi:uncharacterized membrane protein YphA (DoxX/SURF4 family)
MFSESGLARTSLASLLLRLALGVIFIYHGVTKISSREATLGASWVVAFERQQARPPQRVIDKLNEEKARLEEEREEADKKRKKELDQSIAKRQDTIERLHHAYALGAGDRLPEAARYNVVQLLVAWGEVVGGIAVLFGLLTRLATVGLIIIQAGAIATVTSMKGFGVTAGGYEYNVALIAMLLVLLLQGPGVVSVDYAATHQKKRRASKPAPPAMAPTA